MRQSKHRSRVCGGTVYVYFMKNGILFFKKQIFYRVSDSKNNFKYLVQSFDACV